MPNSTYFNQVCPTCGRRLMIRVEYLGKRLVCQHCRGKFEASGSATPTCDCVETGSDLLRRAEELLQSAGHQDLSTHVPTQLPR
jgi:hypothetical protein